MMKEKGHQRATCRVWVTGNNTHHVKSGLLRWAELKTFIDEDVEVALAYVGGHFRSKLGGNDWPLHRSALDGDGDRVLCWAVLL